MRGGLWPRFHTLWFLEALAAPAYARTRDSNDVVAKFSVRRTAIDIQTPVVSNIVGNHVTRHDATPYWRIHDSKHHGMISITKQHANFYV